MVPVPDHTDETDEVTPRFGRHQNSSWKHTILRKSSMAPSYREDSAHSRPQFFSERPYERVTNKLPFGD